MKRRSVYSAESTHGEERWGFPNVDVCFFPLISCSSLPSSARPRLSRVYMFKLIQLFSDCCTQQLHCLLCPETLIDAPRIARNNE